MVLLNVLNYILILIHFMLIIREISFSNFDMLTYTEVGLHP